MTVSQNLRIDLTPDLPVGNEPAKVIGEILEAVIEALDK
jgi:hypothetical protein